MIRLYVVRGYRSDGNGDLWPANELFVSDKYEVTVLSEAKGLSVTYWRPYMRCSSLCYEELSKLLGEHINPGEYIKIEVKVL